MLVKLFEVTNRESQSSRLSEAPSVSNSRETHHSLSQPSGQADPNDSDLSFASVESDDIDDIMNLN